MTAREMAVRALLQVELQDGYSNLVIDNACKKYQLSKEDTAFACALFYGCIERAITLDYIIGQVSSTPLNKMDAKILVILRIAVYQILYMDHIPDRAAVDESVQLAKKMKGPSLAGFVNGVLRTLIRDRQSVLDTIEAKEDLFAKLSIRYSCPEHLIRMWHKHYGEENTLQMLKSSLGKPPLFIRVNTLKTNKQQLKQLLGCENINVSDHPMLENCLIFENTGAVEKTACFAKGLFHVQDAASQICIAELDPKPNEVVLDVCAAPGGKSFTIAQQMQNSGALYSFDLHPSRVQLIEQGSERLGITNLHADVNDASIPCDTMQQADRILCDVPCSGFGIIRRKPEIKYKNLDSIKELPNIQYQILNTSANYLKTGGILVYSTCTLTPAENKKIVAKFLAEHDNFSPISLQQAWGGEQGENDGQLNLFADDLHDGFFIQKLKKMW